MGRLLITVCLLLLAAAAYAWSGRPRLEPLTSESLAALEPEICSDSPWTIALTSIVPSLPRSYTRDMTIDQIALVDEVKTSHWRKIWVLRMPAAFITHRTCDSGRKNWILEGEYRVFSQSYEIEAVVTKDDIVPVTRADQSQRDAGVPVAIWLENRVNVSEKLWRSFGRMSFVNNIHSDRQPPKCREEQSDVPGLIVFRRINSQERG